MGKTILITGATDGIGLLTAQKLSNLGHQLILHGRNAQKLSNAKVVVEQNGAHSVMTYLADFADLTQIRLLGEQLVKDVSQLDVIINNAGIYKISNPRTVDDKDIRFVVNTFAPVLLTTQLLPIMNQNSRVVNVSSAAQESVDLDAVSGKTHLTEDFSAYAQSKLALTMWSRFEGQKYRSSGPAFIAVNPGSLLASKMVRDGFGVPGKDLSIGADILIRCSLEEVFANASGLYFDNDIGDFTTPHSDVLAEHLCRTVVDRIRSEL